MIDWKRPYGEVYPPSYYAYEQDGKLYDRQGREVTPRAEVQEPVEEVPDGVRKIDLRKKENKHLRRLAVQ